MIRGKCGILGALIFQLGRFEILAFTMSICYNCQEPVACSDLGRRQGGQRKRWEDNIREWTGLEFCKSQRAVENREKWEKNGCKIICGAPTTLAVKGLMMMMMNVAHY